MGRCGVAWRKRGACVSMCCSRVPLSDSRGAKSSSQRAYFSRGAAQSPKSCAFVTRLIMKTGGNCPDRWATGTDQVCMAPASYSVRSQCFSIQFRLLSDGSRMFDSGPLRLLCGVCEVHCSPKAGRWLTFGPELCANVMIISMKAFADACEVLPCSVCKCFLFMWLLPNVHRPHGHARELSHDARWCVGVLGASVMTSPKRLHTCAPFANSAHVCVMRHRYPWPTKLSHSVLTYHRYTGQLCLRRIVCEFSPFAQHAAWWNCHGCLVCDAVGDLLRASATNSIRAG